MLCGDQSGLIFIELSVILYGRNFRTSCFVSPGLQEGLQYLDGPHLYPRILLKPLSESNDQDKLFIIVNMCIVLETNARAYSVFAIDL